MNFKQRTLVIVIAAFALMAPVCVLSGGETVVTSTSVNLSPGALVEVIGENAEIKIYRVADNTLKLTATLRNEQFIDFYTQGLTPEPVAHYVISATTSTGGATTANSLLEIGVPSGVELTIQTTNGSISVDEAILTTASLVTTNGKINVTKSSGDFDLSTTNSEVTVQGVDGNVNLTTTNAHVWFEGLITQGASSIATTNGDIAVRLKDGSDVTVTGSTRNGEVTVNSGSDGVSTEGDTATLEHRIGTGKGTLRITNGPGAIHINPETIAVFDGDR